MASQPTANFKPDTAYVDGHYWVENSGLGGEPRFVENRQFSREPVMHVRCKECGVRTWFTEKQWLKEWGVVTGFPFEPTGRNIKV